MPLPGLNPINEAPPADSTEQVATGAMVARLWSKLAVLEQQTESQARRSAGPWQPLTLSYFTGWLSYGSGYEPHYRRLGDGSVELAGLIVNNGTGLVSAIANLPTHLHPVFPNTREVAFPIGAYSGAYTTVYGYIYPWNGSLPGRIAATNVAIVANNYISLGGIRYPTS